MARLTEKYQKEMVPALIEEFKYKSVMAVPKLEKIVLNVGMGEAIKEAKLLDVVSEELSAITGQKAVIRRARKAIAAFKLRQGMPIGVMVTLRGERMYEFFDRLVNIALPSSSVCLSIPPAHQHCRFSARLLGARGPSKTPTRGCSNIVCIGSK